MTVSEEEREFIHNGAPIVISVSGYTTLDDRERVTEDFLKFIDDLDAAYPNTPKVLISGMAPGADVLAAEIALEKGMVVVPVFPFDYDKYVEVNASLCDEGYTDSVKKILGNPRAVKPIVLLDEVEDVPETYRLQSAFLISNAHILVAFWNGSFDQNIGGTSDTVSMAYAGMDARLRETLVTYRQSRFDMLGKVNSLDVNEDSLIYWIRADRANRKDSQIPDDVRGGFIIPRIFDNDSSPDASILDCIHEEMPPLYKGAFQRIDNLNAVLRGREPFTDAAQEIEKSQFLEKESLPESLLPVRDMVVKEGRGATLAYHYNVLNALSIEKRDLNLKITNVLSWIAVFTSLAYSIFMLAAGNILFSVLYLVLLILSLVTTNYYYKKKTYHKYLNYRCIAECLRVEFYRRISGLSSPIHPSSYEDIRNDAIWIGFIVRAWVLEDLVLDKTVFEEREDVLDLTRSCWINSQISYHESKFEVNNKGYIKHQTWGKFLSRFNIFMAAVVLLCMTYLLNDSMSVLHIPEIKIGDILLIKALNVGYVQIARIILMIVVALAARDNFDFSSLKGGSPKEIMAKIQIFRIASIRYQSAKTIDERKAVIYDLGEYSISEQYAWLFEHKKKEFKR